MVLMENLPRQAQFYVVFSTPGKIIWAYSPNTFMLFKNRPLRPAAVVDTLSLPFTADVVDTNVLPETLIFDTTMHISQHIARTCIPLLCKNYVRCGSFSQKIESANTAQLS